MLASIIGFIAVALLALYATAASVSSLFALAFSKDIWPFSLVLAAVACALWALAFHIAPFTVSFQGAHP